VIAEANTDMFASEQAVIIEAEVILLPEKALETSERALKTFRRRNLALTITLRFQRVVRQRFQEFETE
jgi:hypothetical protein